jgi:hypothetical protein
LALDVTIDVEKDPETLFNDFRSRIVGHEIRFRRLAANSLVVYIDHEPGDARGSLQLSAVCGRMLRSRLVRSQMNSGAKPPSTFEVVHAKCSKPTATHPN